ncbi:hypothetical protein SmJEL517_g05950 [Synchytrium microbalum]|uniref:3-oxoacyl-[acyl-carrier-protein] reductase n=1 Tax=Synchytrium microbalum TaxID=1806994 RepID=A0A507BS28_9FUNG|nr:uncharacterized protein SmJEL517_g05950 [Synchytrium microbalum]TPX30492.1 hypothetical protein SmJEL517_g05950 [Synchytrium microbalum]
MTVMDLKDKVAIITGAASQTGLGYGVAERICSKGAKVVLSDFLDEEGKASANALNAKFGEKTAIYVHCDVTKIADQQAMFDAARAEFGRVDIVLNNAGIAAHNLSDAIAEEGTTNWHQIIDINLTAVIQGSVLAYKEFAKSGTKGVIINTASQTGLQPYPNHPLYSSAKWGVVGFTAGCGGAWYDQTGVRVNAICPGYVRTPLLEKGYTESEQMRFIVTASGGFVERDVVVDAFERAITDESLIGKSLSANTVVGVQVFDYPPVVIA